MFFQLPLARESTFLCSASHRFIKCVTVDPSFTHEPIAPGDQVLAE
jgi:hypothetical protein